MKRTNIQLTEKEQQQFKLMRIRSLTDIGGDRLLVGVMTLLGINTTVGIVVMGIVIGTQLPAIITSVLLFAAVGYMAIDPERNYELAALSVMVTLTAFYIVIIFGYQHPELVLTWMFGQLMFTIYSAGLRSAWPLVVVLLFLLATGSYNTDIENLSLTTPQFMVTFIVPFLNSFGFLATSELRLESFYKSMMRTNNEMINATARLELLFETVDEGLIITDPKGTINFINDKALEELRVEEGSMRNRLITEAITFTTEEGDSIDDVNHPFTTVAADMRAVSVGFLSQHRQLMRRGDDTAFLCAYKMSPIMNEGEMIGTLMLFRDITELDSMDKAKTEFVSLASHQLRTPLSVIAWYSEKLGTQKKGKLNDKQVDYLNEIQGSSKRMAKLVNELLNVSRAELDRIKVADEDVNVSAIVEQLESDVSQAAEQRHIKMKVSNNVNRPLLKHSDQSLVEAIIQNLFTNAIKYSHEHTKVKVEMQSVTVGETVDSVIAPNDGVVISVADNGVGIPLDQQTRIFTKMFRAENVKVLDVEGTGLGLYLSKKFAEALGGMLWFTSKEGEGTTFYLFLPRG